MEAYQFKSKIIENDKEFLIQTTNDVEAGVIKTNIFVGGEFLDATFMPHLKNIPDEEMLKLVKSSHADKTKEVEYLLQSYNDALESGQPQMMYHLGTALYYKRMYEEAKNLFETAYQLKNDFHEAGIYLCRVHTQLGTFSEAIRYGETAVSLRSNYADYHNALGEAFLAGKSCKRALIEFEQAVEKNVYYSDAYFNCALTYILNAIIKEDFEMSSDLDAKCRDLFKKATLVQPEYTGDPYYDGIEAFDNADYKRAYALLKQVRDSLREKRRQEKAARFNRFQLFTNWLSGDSVDERITYLEKEIDKNPDYVDLYYDLSVSYLYKARHSWSLAIKNFEKALSLNKDLRKAKRGLDLAQEEYLRISDAVTDIAEKSEE